MNEGRLQGAGRDRAQNCEALQITLSPREKEALAAEQTESAQAYDLYLRGRDYARRLSRPDLESALKIFEHAVTFDTEFAIAHAAMGNVYRNTTTTATECLWIEQ